MRNRNVLITGLLSVLLASPTLGLTISGHMFLDTNNDGVMSPREKPIANVAVSDGQQVVVTSALGQYQLETESGRFVFVSLPRGYRAAKGFYRLAETDAVIDFPMAEWPASKADAVRFAQIADIHVTNKTSAATFVRDLDEINALDPPVQFILAAGDLVNNGGNRPEYENYVRAIAASSLPVFNVPGNHDLLSEAGINNYLRFLGPPHYSFNVGNCHFVVLNCTSLDDKQKAWIAKDLETSPKGSRRIFATHYLPSQGLVDYFVTLGVAAVVSGHWHGDRAREDRGLMDLNTPPLRYGGIDRTARGFRVVDVAKDQVKSELRFGGFRHHAHIVSPAGSCVSRNGKIRVVVNAYDSRCDVAEVECLVVGRRLSLKRVGAWSWVGEMPVSAEFKTPQRLVAEITGVDGSNWRVGGSFQLVENRRKDHLSLAAVAPTGGFIALSSPKVAGGTVVIGVNDRGDLEDCGVCAFNQDLKPRWSFHTDSAVKNNVAVSGGRVYAVTIAGRLYALDRVTGELVWTADLDPGLKAERWEISAATVEGGVVFVGAATFVAAFDAERGTKLWSTSAYRSDWWPSCYVVPTVSDGKLVLMTLNGAHALDAKTGEKLWSLKGKFHGAAVSDGVVYTVKDNVPAAVELATGKLLWKGADQVGDSSSSPALSGDVMVAGTADGRVCAYSTKDGSRLWSFSTGASLSSLQPYKRDISDVNSSPAIANGVVYVGASDGVLYALSLSGGEKLSSYALGVPIASSPLISNGRLYVGAYDGNLYSFDLVIPASAEQSTSP